MFLPNLKTSFSSWLSVETDRSTPARDQLESASRWRRAISRAKAGQIGGNFNTLIMLRVKNTETAELLTDQLPEVNLVSMMVVSSASDTNDPADFADFASRNEDRISTEAHRLLTPADLVQLPKGQAFALIEGGQLYKIRMPLPDSSQDASMPESLQAIAREMEMQFPHTADEHRTLTVNGTDHGL